MPRLRRKSKRRTAWQDLHREILCHGRDYFGDLDDPAEAWQELRDLILPEFIEQLPGRRPWAWWRFEAPARRKRVDGGIHPHDRRTGYRDPEKRLHFGMPSRIQGQDRGALYETEACYLMRLSLLTPAELQELSSKGDNGL